MNKLFLIAGEASGDLHGSNLIQALKVRKPSLKIEFWGGDLMEKTSGSRPKKHFKELAFMGFFEVVKNISQILKNFKQCKKDILDFQPNAIVLIDYPGFNLRIAKWAKKENIRVYYYISPKVWAWKEKRVYKIKKYVDQLFTIFPFETEFFARFNYEVNYVGNPLVDAISNYRKTEKIVDSKETWNQTNKPIIALLPGSRKQEIRTKLPVMIEASKHFADYQLVIAGAPSLPTEFYTDIIKVNPIQLVFGKTYELLEKSTAALVTSGTATLETSLFRVPQVVCYIASPISYSIAKRLLKIKYISLVNLIFDEEIVRELIQNECNVANLMKELTSILPSGDKRETQLLNCDKLIQMLGNGSASEKVASYIYP